MSGRLFVTATPIGNLKDITLRAIETLKCVYVIACEDTRVTSKLLSAYDIHTTLMSYFEYNKLSKGERILGLLKEGRDVALVSDAGTPGISDPGFHLIRLARDAGIEVVSIPGPSAIIAALSISGMPTDKFVYEGFLPQKPGPRRRRLSELAQEERTIVFYESPHRLLKTLKDMVEAFGDIEIAIIREVTKKFEEVRRGRISEHLAHFEATSPRGEFVLVLKLY